jgi:hypothetical protein
VNVNAGEREAAEDQLVDELMLRLWRLALLVPNVVADRDAVSRAVRRTAQQVVAELERSGPRGVTAAREVALTLSCDTAHGQPESWWRTPLGALVSARLQPTGASRSMAGSRHRTVIDVDARRGVRRAAHPSS